MGDVERTEFEQIDEAFNVIHGTECESRRVRVDRHRFPFPHVREVGCQFLRQNSGRTAKAFDCVLRENQHLAVVRRELDAESMFGKLLGPFGLTGGTAHDANDRRDGLAPIAVLNGRDGEAAAIARERELTGTAIGFSQHGADSFAGLSIPKDHAGGRRARTGLNPVAAAGQQLPVWREGDVVRHPSDADQIKSLRAGGDIEQLHSRRSRLGVRQAEVCDRFDDFREFRDRSATDRERLAIGREG